MAGPALCPCSVIRRNWNYQVLSFIGNDYFCESGNPGPDRMDGRFFNDTLWDGLGCESPSCCELNTPPWFCKTLPAPTTDDIELRSCYGDHIENGNLNHHKCEHLCILKVTYFCDISLYVCECILTE